MMPAELVIYGRKAADAIIRHDKTLIKRFFASEEIIKKYRDLCIYLATKRVPYRQVSTIELEKITESTHHEGLALVIEKPAVKKIDEALTQKWLQEKPPLLVLDGVSNPHNFGAICRSALFLGFNQILISPEKNQAAYSGSAWRTSEGSLLYAEIYRPNALEVFLTSLKPHYVICAAALGGETNLKNLKFPENAGLAVVLGNEDRGISAPLLKLADFRVFIDGDPRIDSLNVSVAAGIFLWKAANMLRRKSRLAAPG